MRVFTPAWFDQIIFSRWPMQAAATARARMEEPKYCKVKVLRFARNNWP